MRLSGYLEFRVFLVVWCPVAYNFGAPKQFDSVFWSSVKLGCYCRDIGAMVYTQHLEVQGHYNPGLVRLLNELQAH